jgi:hypothetical protein
VAFTRRILRAAELADFEGVEVEGVRFTQSVVECVWQRGKAQAFAPATPLSSTVDGFGCRGAFDSGVVDWRFARV